MLYGDVVRKYKTINLWEINSRHCRQKNISKLTTILKRQRTYNYYLPLIFEMFWGN